MVVTSAGDTSYTENAPATPIDSAVTVTDSALITGATVQITGGYAGAQDILALAGSHPGITPSFSGDTLTLSGDATPAAYQAALRAVTYSNSSDSPSTAARTVTFTVTDDTSLTSSDTKGVTVSAVDDPPTAVDDSATVAEDSAAGAIDVLANDTDVDGGPRSVGSVTQPANGTVVITGGGSGLTYQPDPSYCNTQPGGTPDTFTYTLNGGSTATVSVTVTCPPIAPVVDTSPGSASYTENAAATPIDSGVTVADPDAGALITGATVQITGGYAGAQDLLALAGSHPGITPSFSGDMLTLSGTATPAAYQAALRAVTYSNSSDSPSTAARTMTFTVTDDTSLTSSDSKGLTVVAVDDPPTAVNDSATVAEDSGANPIDVLANDTDIDGGPRSVSSVSDPANGTVVITGGGTGLTYQPDPNYCNTQPGGTPDTFTYTLNGGDTATVSVTVTCVDDPPTAVNDSATVAADSGANAIDVLANDTDIDGGPKSVASVVQPGNGTVAITGGGTGVSYEPDPTYCNTGGTPDTFTYELNGGSTATVSVTVTCLP